MAELLALRNAQTESEKKDRKGGSVLHVFSKADGVR